MSNDTNVESDAVEYRKLTDECEIARLCVNVTPRLRAFLRENVWEDWPESWLRVADGVEVGMEPFSEDEWWQLIHERIPTEVGVAQ